ncbi:thiamine phosphate synthase [Nocardioides sp. QY071]|uniref:thiamine phosphate synthase n=1 Tax=Nocardioides sp. QY071 TaxID=3044187 RepID=UPI00249B3F56|nr:thiamine phosphate synthase [Nocardioides sp. QY071]WGY03078.1 thiamine phosphate synthase [Nocardioides sp. QY071]
MSAHLFCLVSERDDLSLLPALAEAGVDGFQVRAKSLATGALVVLARSVLAAVRPAGALVVVNDRLDVALAAGADGVHLGADDLAVADARRLAPGLVIGATCRSRAEVVAAADAGADYAGFGPVFASGSKAGLPAPLGVAAVAEAAGVLPLVAIGGITAATAGEVRAAGAHGVAVIGSIWRQPDPLGAAKELVAAVA